MVRTKADCSGIKASGAKAPRKFPAVEPQQSTSSGSSRNSGGNAYKPQPTPNWQKEITSFFGKDDGGAKEDTGDFKPTANESTQD